MWTKTYLDLLHKLLECDLKFLCPWKDVSDNKKLANLFCAFVASPLVLALIMTSFAWLKWNSSSFITIAENLAIAIAAVRSIGYTILVKTFYFDYKRLVDKMLENRKSLPLDPADRSLTDSFCKTEFILTIAFHVNCFCFLLLIHVFVYFFPNEYHLPFNCFIFFLPPDEFLFAWELNYLVHTVAISISGFFIASFLLLPYLLMNNSCWLLDMALLTADEMNEHLQLDEDIRDPERVATTNESLKKLVERCEKFVEWQNEGQDLLSWYFNLEFQIQSLMFCLLIYVMSLNFAGVGLLLFIFCAVQLFTLCWMGERITTRIDQLSFDISQNWHSMIPKQRKTLQMILHWTQNMKGFSGWFSDVSMETCKAIFEASYSLYTFLRSTNEN